MIDDWFCLCASSKILKRDGLVKIQKSELFTKVFCIWCLVVDCDTLKNLLILIIILILIIRTYLITIMSKIMITKKFHINLKAT